MKQMKYQQPVSIEFVDDNMSSEVHPWTPPPHTHPPTHPPIHPPGHHPCIPYPPNPGLPPLPAPLPTHPWTPPPHIHPPLGPTTPALPYPPAPLPLPPLTTHTHPPLDTTIPVPTHLWDPNTPVPLPNHPPWDPTIPYPPPVHHNITKPTPGPHHPSTVLCTVGPLLNGQDHLVLSNSIRVTTKKECQYCQFCAFVKNPNRFLPMLQCAVQNLRVNYIILV